MNRSKRIVQISLIGIAVIMDAVNNLSDALSSVITIVGTKLAGRNLDKKHPEGRKNTTRKHWQPPARTPLSPSSF